MIAAIGPDDWYRTHGPELMGAEAYDDVWTALRDPAVVHGMCEDYPDLLGPDPLARLRGRTDDLRGTGIDSGHHVPEEAPEATAQALAAF